MAESPDLPEWCDLLCWRLERVEGTHPGWLLSLLCAEGHVHFVAHSELYGEAKRIARAWERETLGEDYAGLPIEDREKSARQEAPHA